MIGLDPLTPFGRAWGASGVQNFDGKGYPFHRWLSMIPGFDFNGMTFVGKSMTCDPTPGNMDLDDNLMPTTWKPSCIKVNLWKAAVLNAVGLSNPGAEALFAKDMWQRMTHPFFLSFAPQGADEAERLENVRRFAAIFLRHLPNFHAMVGLQLNITCPNSKEDAGESGRLVIESQSALDELRCLGIPVATKLNILMPPEMAREIERHPTCAGTVISNAVAWKDLGSLGISGKALFGSDESPLARFGGGGLSGAPLLPHVLKWVRDARSAGMRKHINAGGGIMRPRDALLMKEAGATSISIGSMAIVRPYNVQPTIKAA